MATKSTTKASAKPKTSKKTAVTPSKTTTAKKIASPAVEKSSAASKTSNATKKPAKSASTKKAGNGNGSGKRAVLIEQMAYFIAEQRGFEGGDPVQDWLAAERQVDEMLQEHRT